jgi:hypothetical protein
MFKSICQDATIPIKQKAKLLGLDAATFRRMASTRGVRVEGPKGISNAVDYSADLSGLSDVTAFAQTTNHREIWSKLVSERGAQGLTAIREQAQSTYTWLYEHDPAWLKANSPKREQRSRSRASHVDWHSLDTTLSIQVEEVAQRLKLLPRPRRVTLRALSCDLNMEGQLARCLTKLPLTSKAIAEKCESSEDFALRRLWWACDRFIQEHITPTRSALVKRAGLGRWRNCDVVLSAIELAFDTAGTSNGFVGHQAA